MLRLSQSNAGVAEREPIRTGTLRAASCSAMRRPVLPVPPSTSVVFAVMVSGASEVLGYAVEALMLARDWDGAQAQLDRARELGQRFGERILFMSA